MDFYKLIKIYQDKGYNNQLAKVMVAKDVFMLKLSLSQFKDRVTFKGGVVILQLSENVRRTTKDIDLDLISLSIENIEDIFNEIGQEDTNFKVSFQTDPNSMTKLNHLAYEGKRFRVHMFDAFNNSLELTFDVGVHNYDAIMQTNLIFTTSFDNENHSIKLLANSVEQIVVEKTVSFIRFGVFSTRMKDIFDIFYLITQHTIDENRLIECIFKVVIPLNKVKSLETYVSTLVGSLKSERIYINLSKSDNWLDVSVTDIISHIVEYFERFIAT